ncbi:hypothetical protein HPT25_23620 [Bacillus sp. BRMEA1]|uniref:hypothetical protein n=1 Tax=Neobacillus endophyticus TaxID=2738405 RepID=UPI001563D233|nr:hypothetical protein [Neobacillus endophyticus]NRD80315.1 hypothetical protein [Neobacillus endophyticus]
MGKHVYLDTHNAEELLPDVIGLLKSKVAQDSRTKAFKDCTDYWTERVQEIINSDYANETKVEKIRTMFRIEDIHF